jgi:hypothetical protein
MAIAVTAAHEVTPVTVRRAIEGHAPTVVLVQSEDHVQNVLGVRQRQPVRSVNGQSGRLVPSVRDAMRRNVSSSSVSTVIR